MAETPEGQKAVTQAVEEFKQDIEILKEKVEVVPIKPVAPEKLKQARDKYKQTSLKEESTGEGALNQLPRLLIQKRKKGVLIQKVKWMRFKKIQTEQ